MDKAITTAFMVIISIVVSVMVYNTVYPAAVQSSDSLRSLRYRMDDRIRSQIEIVHAAAELDTNGVWSDSNGDGHFNAFIWTKNIGSVRVAAISRLDVFFGEEGNFTRIAHHDETGGSYPYWDWELENDSNWNPSATLRITLHTGATLPSGRYFIKLVLPNGTNTEYYFSF